MKSRLPHLIALITLLATMPLLPGCGESSDQDTIVDAEELLDRYERDRRRHDPKAFVEVDLGEYFVTQRESTAKSFFVRFHIYGVLPENQKGEFTDLLSRRGERMRDAVITTVQRTDVEHLTEPSLAWMKSELIPVVNRSLKTRVLRDIVFTDYSVERG